MGRALGAVRAVTVLSGLKVVLTLDQLAAYVDRPISVLDTGMRNGPVAAAQVERVVQGSYVGYRHPDAAWTGLPSRVAAAREGEEFARWFAHWLEAAGPERRAAARGTARAVAAAARAVGRAALAEQIDGAYRKGRTRPSRGKPTAAVAAVAAAVAAAAQGGTGTVGPAVSRLPAKTTAGILGGTAALLVGAVAGVAVLTGTGPAQAANRNRPPISASPAGAAGPSPSASAAGAVGSTGSAPAHTTRASGAASGAASGTVSGAVSSPGPGGAATPVLAGFDKAPTGAGGSPSSPTSPGTGSAGDGGSGGASGGSSSSSAPAPPSPTPSVATDTSSAAAPATSSPAANSTDQACLNLLGVVGVCL